MNYNFLEKIKKMQQDGFSIQEKTAFTSIVENLFKKNLRGSDKLTELDDYDGETLFGATTLYPGCIYAFKYEAQKPSVYTDPTYNISFEWFDSLPIVLITNISNNVISGINLNMCDYSTKTHIINMLHNLDLDFYNGGDMQMYQQGKRPISNSVAKVFLNKETNKAFYEAVKKECNLKYTGFIYRTYNISRIKNPRLIETWQYKYIPFLKYTGELKGAILNVIWKISGIENRPL